MRLFRLPAVARLFLNDFEWRIAGETKTIFLTFDDGPIPEVTAFVLDQLKQFNARATFFCVGENLVRYPEIAINILNGGHRLGNHTYNHLKGWQTPVETYLGNVEACEAAIRKLPGTASADLLFRPPYGQLSRQQMQALKTTYRLIMWDVLTYDFDATFSAEACLNTTIRLTRPGSIVVFHDSLKARRNLEAVLPGFLKHFHEKGYRFETL